VSVKSRSKKGHIASDIKVVAKTKVQKKKVKPYKEMRKREL